MKQPSDEAGELGPEQGGGPPLGTAWSLIVIGDVEWSADLEHAAPLPRVGERIEYIALDGARRNFVVREIVHTLQPASSERPPVHSEETLPNTTVQGSGGDPGILRAGLPRVYVEPID